MKSGHLSQVAKTILLFFFSFIYSFQLIASIDPVELPKLPPWELKTLNDIRTVLREEKDPIKALSPETLIAAIQRANSQASEPGFQILDPKVRLGICQLIAWYVMEIAKDQRAKKAGLDELLLQILSPAKTKVGAKFTPEDLKENLIRLGLLGQTSTISMSKLWQLYNLYEGWLTFRAIQRLTDGEDPLKYMEPKKPKEKYSAIKIVNYDELSRRVFTTKFRDKSIVLAYHDGIPSLQNVMTYSTVTHVMILKFNNDTKRWEIQTRKEHFVRGGDGLKVKRVKSDEHPDSFVMTQDPLAVTDEAEIERVVLPQDGQDYAVVHMGNIFHLNKGFDDTFLQGLGLEGVNFEEMFLRTSPDKALPGSLSIFHFNAVKNFDMGFFKALESYVEPNEGGFSFMMGGTRGNANSNKQNHPILIQEHYHNPWYGDFNVPPGLTVTHSVDGKKMSLRLVAEKNGEGSYSYKFESSSFLRNTKLSFEHCWLRYGTFRPATMQEWVDFVNMFEPYLNTDIAPLVRQYLNGLGFTKENLPEWIVQGAPLIANGMKATESNYDFHLCPINEKEIERTKEQLPLLSAIRKTQLHSGFIVPSKINPHEPSGSSLFDLVDLPRKQYIQRIVGLMRDPTTDPYMVNLIEIAMKELDIQKIDEWEMTFDNPHLWTTYTHMRILAEMFGLRIMLYQLSHAQEEKAVGEAIFVPLEVENPSNRVIGRGPDDMHVGVVNAHFLDKKRCHSPMQFEQIHIPSEKESEVCVVQVPLDPVLEPVRTNVNETDVHLDWDTDLQIVLSQTLWMATSGSSM